MEIRKIWKVKLYRSGYLKHNREDAVVTVLHQSECWVLIVKALKERGVKPWKYGSNIKSGISEAGLEPGY